MNGVRLMASRKNNLLRAGDMVRVRPAPQILKTLDESGTLDNLPFMLEMVKFCNKRFRVQHRVVQATIDGKFLTDYTESWVREFRNNDVFILEGLRCAGQAHGDCDRGCALFWKEAWLERIPDQNTNRIEDRDAHDPALDELVARLKTKKIPERYFCQSSELLKATLHLSHMQRLKKCFSAVAAANITALGMLKRILVWTWWKMYGRLFGSYAHGSQEKTPTESLGLQPGELVEVKSFPEIVSTLSKTGFNRGLHFSADQRPFCGRQFRVRSRTDNFIVEGTGEMKHFRNTVTLEDALCDSACFAFGGCYRADLLYWREIWLKRVEPRIKTLQTN